ncbi:MAG: aldo/keto reductase [Butyrivibrio sp.]|nr:aldo/keto reductase [Butyrivibrio sp.]
MQYRNDRNGTPLSILGYGCMRFTKKNGAIDIDKAETEIRTAIDRGVNYFDTAYIYPGSEAALGEILERNQLRDRINIATKLPQYLIGSRGAIDRYFGEQLTRLRTDHVDYYLMHMLTDIKAWENLVKNGIQDWIREQKEAGRIRQIGFSFHGNTEMFLKILNAYDWDFCQIQYNYMDEVSQAGREGLQAAAARGIPVIIMEPLRGGKLVDLLPAEAKQAIARDGKKRSPAALAFEWLWDQPEVTVVLSGMNSQAMVEENCRIADAAQPGMFTETDRALIERVKEAIRARLRVGCTGCGYCMPCPQGVDIPGAFYSYNEMYISKKAEARFEYARMVGIRKKPALPSQCIGCGACERKCPQHLSIIEELKKANRALLPLPYRTGISIARRFMLNK